MFEVAIAQECELNHSTPRHDGTLGSWFERTFHQDQIRSRNEPEIKVQITAKVHDVLRASVTDEVVDLGSYQYSFIDDSLMGWPTEDQGMSPCWRYVFPDRRLDEYRTRLGAFLAHLVELKLNMELLIAKKPNITSAPDPIILYGVHYFRPPKVPGTSALGEWAKGHKFGDNPVHWGGGRCHYKKWILQPATYPTIQ